MARTRTLAARLLGRALVAGAAACSRGDAAPRPGDGAHPHEPAGYVRITERPFSAANEGGWLDEDGTPGGGEPTASFAIVNDPAAPRSPGRVGAITFPAGYSGGGRTSLLGGSTFGGLRPARGLYLEFWFRVSENWYAHTGGQNKIFYVGHPVVVEFGYGLGRQPVQLWVALQGGETSDLRWNSAANQVRPTARQAELVRGRWHHVELLLRMNTPGRPDGEVHLWMNGVKTHQFVHRSILAASGQNGSIGFLAWRPIYGGQGGERVPAAQRQFLDHLYLSRSP